MKRIFHLFWQVIILPILFIPYKLLNQFVIVKLFGCGCPTIAENGETINSNFNANNFTQIFWLVIALTVIAISIFSLRKIAKWYYKVLYIIIIVCISFFTIYFFTKIMMWK